MTRMGCGAENGVRMSGLWGTGNGGGQEGPLRRVPTLVTARRGAPGGT
jgi:hypothetical protein